MKCVQSIPWLVSSLENYERQIKTTVIFFHIVPWQCSIVWLACELLNFLAHLVIWNFCPQKCVTFQMDEHAIVCSPNIFTNFSVFWTFCHLKFHICHTVPALESTALKQILNKLRGLLLANTNRCSAGLRTWTLHDIWEAPFAQCEITSGPQYS